jgi:hypothetical protein
MGRVFALSVLVTLLAVQMSVALHPGDRGAAHVLQGLLASMQEQGSKLYVLCLQAKISSGCTYLVWLMRMAARALQQRMPALR